MAKSSKLSNQNSLKIKSFGPHTPIKLISRRNSSPCSIQCWQCYSRKYCHILVLLLHVYLRAMEIHLWSVPLQPLPSLYLWNMLPDLQVLLKLWQRNNSIHQSVSTPTSISACSPFIARQGNFTSPPIAQPQHLRSTISLIKTLDKELRNLLRESKKHTLRITPPAFQKDPFM